MVLTKYKIIEIFINYIVNTFKLLYYFDWNLRFMFKYKFLDQYEQNFINFSKHNFPDNPLSYKFKQSKYLFSDIPDAMAKLINTNLQFPTNSYTVFQKVLLAGPNAIPISEDGQYILHPHNKETKDYLSKSSPKSFMYPDKEKIVYFNDETVINLVSPWLNEFNKNYFHWIIEGLLPLQSLFLNENLISTKLKVIINKDPSNYQLESLNMLGIPHNSIHEWDHDLVYCKKLVLSKKTQFNFSNVDIIYPQSIDWLRDLLSVHNNGLICQKDRIFISRQNSNGRKIQNYTEILDVLKKFNIEPVYLEKLSFYEQFNIFSKAKFIMGAHGAGLINIIFSKNAKIFELFGNPPDHFHMYYCLSQIIGHDYYFNFNNYDYSHYNETNFNSYWKEHDIYVDPSKLSKIFNKIL